MESRLKTTITTIESKVQGIGKNGCHIAWLIGWSDPGCSYNNVVTQSAVIALSVILITYILFLPSTQSNS